jgi:hypothetical protein
MQLLFNWISPAAIWGLAAAVPAVWLEYMYRQRPDSWIDNLWLYIPAQLAISFCIYKLVTQPSTTLMDAFVIWALSTTAFRVFVSVVLLHDTVKGGTWFALGLLTMARIAQTFWGR